MIIFSSRECVYKFWSSPLKVIQTKTSQSIPTPNSCCFLPPPASQWRSGKRWLPHSKFWVEVMYSEKSPAFAPWIFCAMKNDRDTGTPQKLVWTTSKYQYSNHTTDTEPWARKWRWVLPMAKWCQATVFWSWWKTGWPEFVAPVHPFHLLRYCKWTNARCRRARWTR